MIFCLLLITTIAQQFTCNTADKIDIDVIDSVRTLSIEVPHNKNQPSSFPGCGDAMNDHTIWYTLSNKLTTPTQIIIKNALTQPPTSIFLRISRGCPTSPSINTCVLKDTFTHNKDTIMFTLPVGAVYNIALFVNGLSQYSTQLQVISQPVPTGDHHIKSDGDVCAMPLAVNIPFVSDVKVKDMNHVGNSYEKWLKFHSNQQGKYIIKTCSQANHDAKLQFYSSCGVLTNGITEVKCPTGYGFVYTIELPITSTIIHITTTTLHNIPLSIRHVTTNKLMNSDIRHVQQITVPFKETVLFENCHHSSDNCNVNLPQTSAVYYSVVVPIGEKVIVRPCNSHTSTTTRVSIFENLYYNTQCHVNKIVEHPCATSIPVEWTNTDQKERKIVVRVGENNRDSFGEAEIYIDVVPAGITAVQSKIIEEHALPHWAPDSVQTREDWVHNMNKKNKAKQIMKQHKYVVQSKDKRKAHIPSKTNAIRNIHHPVTSHITHHIDNQLLPHHPDVQHHEFKNLPVHPPQTPTHTHETTPQHHETITNQITGNEQVKKNTNTNANTNTIEMEKKLGAKGFLVMILIILVIVSIIVIAFVYFKKQNTQSEYLNLID